MVDTHVAHLGVDGAFLRSTDGRAAFTGPSGDALFLSWSGAARPTETANLYAFAGAFTITGGKGRYAGAIGSGVMNSRVNLATFEVAQVWEGFIVPTKK